MGSKLTSKELGHLVDQIMGTLPPDQPVKPTEVIDLIRQHQLVSEDTVLDTRRVYHRLNNGRRTRYHAVGGGRFVRRLGIAWPKPSEFLGINPSGQMVAACKADDFENLVGGLLTRLGFNQVRFTNPVSRQGDGGVDLKAMLPVPVGPSIRHIVAVTGCRIDAKRLAQYRGLARQHERVMVVAHQVSPKLRAWSEARRFNTQMICLDAADVQAKLDQVKLTVAEAIHLGADLRRHQHHASAHQAS